MKIKPFVINDHAHLIALEKAGAMELTFDIPAQGAGRLVFRGGPAYKFALVQNSTLLVGPIAGHLLLLGAYHLRSSSMAECVAGLKRLRLDTWSMTDIFNGLWRELNPVSFGNISGSGEIVRWYSQDFKTETPDELKPFIQQTIAQAFDQGLLAKDG